MIAVPEPSLPTVVGPGADGSVRRLEIRSWPFRHWTLAVFLVFLSAFMFFRIVRGTVEDLIVGIASTGWWQYAAAGLLCSIALAVAAQGEVEVCRFDKVEDTFVLITWSIRSGRGRVRRFPMSSISSIKPCILQRNTEHKHYKIIIGFADSTRVFVLDTRSRQIVVDNVRRIRLYVFDDSATASRRVARRRRRREREEGATAGAGAGAGGGATDDACPAYARRASGKGGAGAADAGAAADGERRRRRHKHAKGDKHRRRPRPRPRPLRGSSLASCDAGSPRQGTIASPARAGAGAEAGVEFTFDTAAGDLGGGGSGSSEGEGGGPDLEAGAIAALPSPPQRQQQPQRPQQQGLSPPPHAPPQVGAGKAFPAADASPSAAAAGARL